MPFEVRVPDVAECQRGDPAQVTRVNAERKALAVAAGLRDGEARIVLGVDTVVALDGRTLGKPADEREARGHLRALSGRVHAVHSGLCLIDGGRRRSALATTSVRFATIGERELDWYVASGEWRERAGGYAIQGRGAALVRAIQGDFFNVVGLPVPALLQLAPELLQ